MRLSIILCVVYLSICVIVPYCHSADVRVDPLVLINQGLVRGERASDGQYSTFLGIPYAHVDLENPFGPAVEHPGFGDTVFNAYDGSISCPQADEASGVVEGILDCLRLNIYVPTKASSKNPLPVLVWIHGGTFILGKAGLYGGHNLVDQDIVLVTINYRLGPYGFMCLDIPTVPGNQGLKDQLSALRWIKQNIAAFGGNPYNVTIAGQSSGAASVEYHLFSSHEKLFNKAILQSGVASIVDVFSESDEQAAAKLAEHLGFNTTDTDQALQFLASTSPNLIVAATEELGLKFLACKEKSFSGVEIFVENAPYSMANSNKIKNTPIMIGVNSKESYGSSSLDGDLFYAGLKELFNLEESELKKVAAIVRHFYLGDEAPSDAVISQLDDFKSDFEFFVPVEMSLSRLLDNNASVIYEYVYNYVSENDHGEKNAAPHSAELKYLFASDYEKFTDEEKLISDRVTSMWTNFVKYGNPTPVTSDLVPVTWEPVSKDSRPYLRIDTEISMEHRFRRQSMAFWDLFYTTYGQYSKLNRDCNKGI